MYITLEKPLRLDFKQMLKSAFKSKKKQSLGWNKPFKEYLQDIEICISDTISKKQLERLKYALENNSYRKLSSSESKSHRAKYRVKKKQMIKDWEDNLDKTWKTYDKPIYSKRGEVVRQRGALYDFHHIIPVSYGGNNEWWNGVPAKFPKEHQQGIHRKNGPADKLFR